jgi:hypothetical protein
MAHGPRNHKAAELQVSEGGRRFVVTNGPQADSRAMNETPGPGDRYGDAPEVPLRWEAEHDAASPDIRKFARSASDVDRDRPHEVPTWVGPVVGVVTFSAVMTLGCIFMYFWFTRQRAVVEDVVIEDPTELDGLPVRKNLREIPEE